VNKQFILFLGWEDDNNIEVCKLPLQFLDPAKNESD